VGVGTQSASLSKSELTALVQRMWEIETQSYPRLQEATAKQREEARTIFLSNFERGVKDVVQ
jgi:hypothetical protein